jgi:hypothetical protein
MCASPFICRTNSRRFSKVGFTLFAKSPLKIYKIVKVDIISLALAVSYAGAWNFCEKNQLFFRGPQPIFCAGTVFFIKNIDFSPESLRISGMNFASPFTPPPRSKQADDLVEHANDNLTAPTSPPKGTKTTFAIREVFRKYGAQIITGFVALASAIVAIVYAIVNEIKRRRKEADATQSRGQQSEANDGANPSCRPRQPSDGGCAYNNFSQDATGARRGPVPQERSTGPRVFAGSGQGSASNCSGYRVPRAEDMFRFAFTSGGNPFLSGLFNSFNGSFGGFANGGCGYQRFFSEGPFGFFSSGSNDWQGTSEATGESHVRREFPNKDLYAVLGVGRKSSPDEIKKAYRKLAMKFHPDKNNNKSDTTAKFQEICEAHDILKDPAKRAGYDQEQPNAGLG